MQEKFWFFSCFLKFCTKQEKIRLKLGVTMFDITREPDTNPTRNN